MAAYSPVQRLESFRRKARQLDPDLVIYSATMLDPRLTQIHVCGLLQDRADWRATSILPRPPPAPASPPTTCGWDPTASWPTRPPSRRSSDRQLWPIIDATLGELAAACRSDGHPAALLIVPRAGEADAPGQRGADVARYPR